MRDNSWNFNLLTEPWIPVLWQDGNLDRRGILDILREAPRIREIAAPNPLDRVALLRFLLALTYWCQGKPEPAVLHAGPAWFSTDSWRRLEKHRADFNLFGTSHRFYQCRIEDRRQSSPNQLLHEIPSGTNANHFRHARDFRDGLCPACCALALVRLPAFATQGGKGRSPGINAAPPVYVVPLGDSLAETILFSWRPSAIPLGRPAWSQPDLLLPHDKPVPLLTGLTWLPWRVWLHAPEASEAPCIACGARSSLVRRASVQGRGSRPKVQWTDPHTVATDKGLLRAPNRFEKALDAACFWVDLLVAATRVAQQTNARRFLTVGFATDQMKFFEVIEFTIHLPPQTAAAVAQQLPGLQDWCNRLRPRRPAQRQRAGSRPPERPSLAALRALSAMLTPALQHDFARSYLAELQSRQIAPPSVDYGAVAEAIASSLCPGWTVQALVERRKLLGHSVFDKSTSPPSPAATPAEALNL